MATSLSSGPGSLPLPLSGPSPRVVPTLLSRTVSVSPLTGPSPPAFPRSGDSGSYGRSVPGPTPRDDPVSLPCSLGASERERFGCRPGAASPVHASSPLGPSSSMSISLLNCAKSSRISRPPGAPLLRAGGLPGADCCGGAPEDSPPSCAAAAVVAAAAPGVSSTPPELRPAGISTPDWSTAGLAGIPTTAPTHSRRMTVASVACRPPRSPGSASLAACKWSLIVVGPAPSQSGPDKRQGQGPPS